MYDGQQISFYTQNINRKEYIMTTFCTLNNKIRIVNEQKLMDLTNRWLPKDLDTDIKTAFADSVRFLLADIELDNPFIDCPDFSIESYYFLACLFYAHQKCDYKAVITCMDDLDVLDCLGLVSKDVYDEFIKVTKDNSMTTEEFISWCKQNPRYRKKI